MTIEFQNTIDTPTLNSIIKFLQSKQIAFVVKNDNVESQSTKFVISQIADDWECPEEWANS